MRQRFLSTRLGALLTALLITVAAAAPRAARADGQEPATGLAHGYDARLPQVER
jgi:hypothetical protein